MFNFLKKQKATPKKTSSSLKQKLIKSKQKLSDSLAFLLLGKKQINNNLLEELETLLITADIGINTTDKILENLRKKATHTTLKDEDSLYKLLKNELTKLLKTDNKLNIDSAETFVILVVGVNGVGKTTTIGKLAKHLKDSGKTVMLAAGDTFRAAAVEQLKIWGLRNGVPVIAQKTGADAASVVFDAYNSALAKNINVLIVDTAGRMHTQNNLMQELTKIKRVLQKKNKNIPQETMLIIDGNSGQNALSQTKEFNKAVRLDSLSVTKLDGTAKGGVLFTIANETNLPIRYIGVGESIDDLIVFEAEKFVDALFD